MVMKRTGFKKKLSKPMKKTPLRKISKRGGKTKLHKDLWKLFSKYIRERDKYVCFTCGKKTYPAQAGHYRTGATCKKYLYYDERNVHCQCYHCNINLSGNWREYQKKMHQIYGQGIDHEFDVLNQKDGWDFPYQEKIDYYKELLK